MAVVGDMTSSRRVPFLIGLAGLLSSVLSFWLARSFVVLFIARLLQGFSAVVVWVCGLAIIADTFEKEKLGSAMSYITLADVLGKVISPTVGGITWVL